MEEKKTYRKYSGAFKQEVLESMHKEHMSQREAAKRYGIKCSSVVRKWEKIYEKEGYEGLYKDRRGGNPEGRRRQLTEKEKEDLEKRVEWLEMENAYLKKLQALVQERQKRTKKSE
ncbi:helix-turn-helix domain-containing protein [Anaeromassilibacillus senegalensis]|uniref:helix-turn-helix domain-containing protein n=1 Tax=Anaeromassilibacillus senegalensis TaxID=1673717 RepID=UPI00093E79FB|nr:helix-turn-helix domain-containing protein [Anaeromassilibacillus senegalensis]